MKKNFVILPLFMAFTSAPAIVLGATTKCEAPQFAKNPQMNQKIYEVNFTASCTLENASASKSLLDLKNKLLKNLISKLKVNGSPENETYRGLKSIKLTATESSADRHGDTLSIESIFHVATDGYAKLIYSSESAAIKATGDSAHLRKNDLSFNIARKYAETFTVNFYRLTQVEKPWYAPNRIFISEVDKNVRQDFTESVSEQIKEIAQFF